MKTYKTVDEYIKNTPKNFVPKLKEMRSLVHSIIPQGEECISYGMPTIKLHGKNFIHYASMKGHLGFYPTPSGVKMVEQELKKNGTSFSKGCIRFPYNEPLPVKLITKIIKFRIQEEKGIR